MSIAAIALAALLPEALPLQAQERQQEPTPQEGRRIHVVRTGDTLWDLAEFYLTDPFLWPEIYRLNTIVVEDPHWIYPAEELLVPGPGEVIPRPIPGEQPVPGEEVVERVPTPDMPTPPEVVPEGPQPMPVEERATIFAVRDVGATTLTYQPIAPVPPVAVSQSDFYRAGMLLPLAELGPRGEVVDPAAPRGFAVEPMGTIHRFGRFYVSHPDGEPPDIADRMLVFRVERRVKPWGYVIRPTGMATIAAVYEDVSIAVLTEVYDRVLIGDQAMQAQRFVFQPGVFAEPVATGPSGELVALMDEQLIATSEDFVFIDVGRGQGVLVGDEFELYARTRRTREGLSLPEEFIGTGRVVRVTERTSTLRLLDMRHPTIDVGLPVRLVRKMPS
ncbi:MAG: LysM peptidoglycan-binding domain-containing protein [Gemmatimonadota bacterium]|nr:MAG: LysM peptidoglycan-binding domain-containing protein [Gemmatimonadota bacterium]